uniref:Uncharacterized protein n=1 Tax=Parascaris equorum TaxID=6256 RepID=A0A914RBL7_PAREQ
MRTRIKGCRFITGISVTTRDKISEKLRSICQKSFCVVVPAFHYYSAA